MRRLFFVAILFTLFAFPTLAQNPNPPANGATPGPDQRRFQPPPHHWMTIDSLSQAIRERMQASGGFAPGQEPTPAHRARFDSGPTEMEGFQAEADQYYAAIRNNLTPDQQAKLDALPKPQVVRRGPMGGGQPRQ